MTDTTQQAGQLEATIDVAAEPAQVWAQITDLAAMARWSPQVVKTIVRGGAVRLGTNTININHKGLLVWPTRSRVVRFDPHREFAFKVLDNYTVWSFTLEPTDGGTRIIQRRETPQGISSISNKLVDLVLGGQKRFTGELREGMAQTLARIKDDVESR